MIRVPCVSQSSQMPSEQSVMTLRAIVTSMGACSLTPAISWPQNSLRSAMLWMRLSSMRENAQPRWPTTPAWPQSWMWLRRTTCDPIRSLSQPMWRAANTDSSWYW